MKNELIIKYQVTLNCDLRCLHCLNGAQYRKTPQSLPHSKYSPSKIAEYLAATGATKVLLTGGEPLSAAGYTLDIADELRRRRIEVGIFTNATLITRRLAFRMLRLSPIVVTLYSYDKDTHNKMVGMNAFDRTIRGIKELVNNGSRLSVFVNMVVGKLNYMHVVQTCEFVKSLGVESFAAQRMICQWDKNQDSDYVLSRGELSVYLKSLDIIYEKHKDTMQIKRHNSIPMCADVFARHEYSRCPIGTHLAEIVVDTNGDVYPCQSVPISHGNIFNGDSWESIWVSMKRWRETYDLPEICKSCELHKIGLCDGGCYVMRRGGIDPHANPKNVSFILRDLNK